MFLAANVQTPKTSPDPYRLAMKYAIWSLVGLLLILHQDYWQWDTATLDFGFMPRALTYHAGLSMAAAVVWVLATRFCWPEGLEDAANDAEVEDQKG